MSCCLFVGFVVVVVVVVLLLLLLLLVVLLLVWLLLFVVVAIIVSLDKMSWFSLVVNGNLLGSNSRHDKLRNITVINLSQTYRSSEHIQLFMLLLSFLFLFCFLLL
jgi:hypothetical protein